MNEAKRLRELEDRVAALEASRGKLGTGVCICGVGPAHIFREAQTYRPQIDTMERALNVVGRNMGLDHRCPLHGEKAQPALWGRNKDKVLIVEPHEWLSLGIAHESDMQPPPPRPSKL